MTYQQLFDEAIGDVPVATIDVERVIGRQRRAHRLRVGAACTAVAGAVLAVTLAATTLVGTPHTKVPPTTPSPTTVPGTDQDLDRIDAAVVAALVRAEPRLYWATKGAPASTTPNWESRAGGLLPDATLASGYFGEGSVRIGTADVRLELRIDRDGAAAWKRFDRPCQTTNEIECGERTGPGGQRIKVRRATEENNVPTKFRDRIPRRTEIQEILALRRDGSLVWTIAATTGEDSRLPLTAEQLTTVALDPAIVLGAPRDPSPTPSSTVTTVAGTVQDAARLDEAATAAFRRQAPGFTWTTKWGGKDSPTPVGSDPKGRLSVNEPTLSAPFRVGNRGGGVTLRLVRDGRAAWENAPPCPTAGLAGRNCTVSDGPGGEKIRARHLLRDFGWRGDLHRPTLGGGLLVEVLRPDGTLVYMSLGEDKTALSMAQLIEAARDPALVLAPLPPAGAGIGQSFGGINQYYHGAEATAAGAALDDVSPDGTIYLEGTRYRISRPIGTELWSFAFLVQRAGLAGDGEIFVQRRSGITASCATVRSLSPETHVRHPHDGECTESTRPDGSRVISIVSRSSGTVTYDVFVQRPDRGTVEVVLDNRPNTGSATDMPELGELHDIWPKDTKGGANPPLTLDQVTELAAHPDLVNMLP